MRNRYWQADLRDLSKRREVEIVWERDSPALVVNSWTLTGDDLKAINGFDAPQRVKLQTFDKPQPVLDERRSKFQLAPTLSYNGELSYTR